MNQIITVIKDGKKSTRIGSDAINCLGKIKLNSRIPKFTAFTKDVARKLHTSMARVEMMDRSTPAKVNSSDVAI